MNEATRQTILDGERALIAAQGRADAATVARLLAEDFREIGKSGRSFDKHAVLASLGHSTVTDYSIEAVEWLEVDEDCVILLYLGTVTRRSGGHALTHRARRSSTWRRERDGWRMLFHQGTPLPP
jgi:hypothetical protein